MKNKLFGLLLLLLPGVMFASGKDIVETCPDLSLIKAEGITSAKYYFTYGYLAYNKSHYNTDKEWIFGIGFIDASNSTKAEDKGNELLLNVTGEPTPTFDKSYRAWVCEYQVADGYTAIAETGRDLLMAPMVEARRK